MPRLPNTSSQTRGLLRALSVRPHTWRYGYALSKLTGLKSGTLYPLLIRLEAQGLLASRWEAVQKEGRPPRHTYRLTSAGLAFAREAGKTLAVPKSQLRLKET